MCSMLAVGRAVGLDNLSQMKGLIRGITQGTDGVYTAKLNFTTKELRDFNNTVMKELPDSFQKQQAMTQQEMSYSLAKTFFPRAMADNVKNTIDIVVKKVGDTIKGLGIKTITKDEQGEIGRSIFRADLDDIDCSKFTLNAKSTESAIDANVELSGPSDLYGLLKNLKYTTEGSKGVVTTQNGDNFVRMEAPVDYMDYASRIQSGKGIQEYIADVQNLADSVI